MMILLKLVGVTELKFEAEAGIPEHPMCATVVMRSAPRPAPQGDLDVTMFDTGQILSELPLFSAWVFDFGALGSGSETRQNARILLSRRADDDSRMEEESESVFSSEIASEAVSEAAVSEPSVAFLLRFFRYLLIADSERPLLQRVQPQVGLDGVMFFEFGNSGDGKWLIRGDLSIPHTADAAEVQSMVKSAQVLEVHPNGRVVSSDVQLFCKRAPSAVLEHESRMYIRMGMGNSHIVCGLFTFDIDDSHSQLVTQAGMNRDLNIFIAKMNRASLSQKDRMLLATHILWQIADGLTYAHQNRIIHMDINPKNIVINQDRIMIADWELAQIVNRHGYESNCDDVGTCGYIAPELHGYYRTESDIPRDLSEVNLVMASGNAEFKSDIWSLGILFLQLLTPQFDDQLIDRIHLCPTVLKTWLNRCRSESWFRVFKPLLLKMLVISDPSHRFSASEIKSWCERKYERIMHMPFDPASERWGDLYTRLHHMPE